jgi:hypothetical protein
LTPSLPVPAETPPSRLGFDHPPQVRQGEHLVEDVRGRAASTADATLGSRSM